MIDRDADRLLDECLPCLIGRGKRECTAEQREVQGEPQCSCVGRCNSSRCPKHGRASVVPVVDLTSDDLAKVAEIRKPQV